MRLIDADKRFEEMAYNILEEYASCYSEVDKESLAEYIQKNTVDIKTEVAREIFAEIDIPLQRFMNEHDYSLGNLIFDVAELKNKYIKDGVGE